MVKKEKIVVEPLSELELKQINEEVEGLEFEITGYDISGFKKGWRKQYETVTYSDGLSTEEGKIFKEDSEFRRLVIESKKAQKKVHKYMDAKLKKYRMEHPKEPTMEEKVAMQKTEKVEAKVLEEHLMSISGIKEA
ncbi:hypothetical protein [Methanobacterium paludis]|uniref:Uncharacterized protein n=1 Tax=Methanobacterium paludis (strain DSM 25820 / JCM 18151 / SWAN1) TaxID=868131 RepID=F6D396_METPW|nr:hypothetical protein [Methanobacterium paludis]AEG18688.1 hypothetical protein MSWAN_1677 [Methanobacterium paludis]